MEQEAIIVYGPQASGKTRNAQALKEHFGCSAIVDDWDHTKHTTPGALHLTNFDLHGYQAIKGIKLIPISEALSALLTKIDTEHKCDRCGDTLKIVPVRKPVYENRMVEGQAAPVRMLVRYEERDDIADCARCFGAY